MSFTFDFKKIIRNRAQICGRCSLLKYFAMLSRFHSSGRIHEFGSVTRIAFNLSINLRVSNKLFSKRISLSIILRLFFHNSRSKHSRKTTSFTSITSVRLRRIIAFNFYFRVHLFVQLSIFLSQKFSVVKTF